ncbi:hypothetical protein GCM10007973_16270 [Polymorphobacter multimanifer]|uniref:Formylglycine-generating enzyme required for sulfatase activity n=1 Tax=Polymorphobacter multimanifer TaxID=1070431 RepID=A0A841L7Q7_9SPHN|nr:formylglycine-generating enzyme family protein [Polymorphobacter multimanifer]MBB6228470.1 formylglycine-generating enzyme required for sulfatase activity [Polymorphobacter multimanifer]GGI80536.1 hypothetical protein GCM10007973_16270 [Polymorphobacter multimanifer]
MKIRTSLLASLLLLAACGSAPEVPTPRCPAITPRSIAIPGGTVTMGSENFHAEEAPIRTAQVAAFGIDATEVTNAQFAAFVAATGHVTTAERLGGGAVFSHPARVVNLDDLTQWWQLDPQAQWRHPHGAGSTADPARPVVQVTLEDARAYARWAGRALPTEAEWEHAARGGLANADYSWGNDRKAAATHANHWQGIFPIKDTGDDGFKSIAPAGCFKPNGYGLHDMAGNVWELTETAWDRPDAPGGSSVIKGGSWLCANNFCLRYRPAARQPGDPEMPTDHIGFRTITRLPAAAPG